MYVPPELRLAAVAGVLVGGSAIAGGVVAGRVGASPDASLAWALAVVPLPGALVGYLAYRWPALPPRYRRRLVFSPLVFAGVGLWQVPELTGLAPALGRGFEAAALALGVAYLLVVLTGGGD